MSHRRSDAVYLHYLDRELNEAAGRFPHEQDLIRATRLLTFFTQSELYCGLSAIWENHRLGGRTREDFELLLRCGEMQTVSRDATLAEFKRSRAIAYLHDRDRYLNYYTQAGDRLEWLVPTWSKAGGSTAPLLQSMNSWAATIPVHNYDRRFMPAIHAAREPVQEAILRRETQAITYSYFKGFLGDLGENPHVEYAVRRQISRGFTADNQRHGGGDIATGIPELVDFDDLSVDFPNHDIHILGELAAACNMSKAFDVVQLGADFWVKYVQCRTSSEAQLLASTVRWLLTGLYLTEFERHPAAAEDEVEFHGQHQIRRRMLMKVREVTRGSGRPNFFEPEADPEDIIEHVQNHLAWIAERLAKRDPVLGHILEESRGRIGMDGADVLLVTVNEAETKALRAAFRDAGHSGRSQFGAVNTYSIYGPISGAVVAHVRCSMGSGGQGGSSLTVTDAIRDLKPSSVIGVGVAFGMDERQQAIGEVLLSEKLTSYEPQRLGSDSGGDLVVTPRGPSAECSPRLLGRFRDVYVDDLDFKINAGEMLSGEKLIDNSHFKRALLEKFPESIGGEMEGAGVHSAAGRANTDWIVAKSVCDYAERKSHDKEARQALAARNAARLVMRALESGGLAKP